jgi:PAS domain S-box-containing protein
MPLRRRQSESATSRAVDYAIVRILAEAPTLAEATPELLECIGEALGFELGAIWVLDRDEEIMRYVDTWQARGVEAENFLDLTRTISFAPGVGLPGRVWATGEPAIIGDVMREENFPRAAAAGEAGLHSAVGFPIRGKTGFLGVIEFYTTDIRRPSAELIELLTFSGGHIGQFIERMQGEEEVRRSEELKTAMLESALDGVIAIDHKGCILEFNPAAEKTFGYARADVLGEEMANLVVPPRFRDRHRRGLERFLATGESTILDRRIELTATRSDESEFPVELAIARIGTEEPPMFIGYVRDITDRRKKDEALQFLVRASAALDVSLELNETMQTLARLTVPYLADGCMVDLLELDGTIRRAAHAAADASWEPVLEELQRHPIDPSGPHPIARAMTTGQIELVPDVSEPFRREISQTEEYYEALSKWPAKSALIVPIRVRDRILGTMALASFSSERTYGADEISLLEELGRRAGNALENARLFDERTRIARMLQQSLLPPHLPHVPGAEVAARFQPADVVGEVGGDFYDVFDTGSGVWAIAIGDVAGRGPEAAAITVLARHTIRAASIREADPAAILKVLNEALRSQVEELRFCTAALGLLSLGDAGARLSLVSAGHPLPLLLRADGQVEPIGRPGTILGVVPEPTLVIEEVELAKNDTVVFYTDGVFQSRGGEAMFEVDELTLLVGGCAELNAVATADCIDEAVVHARREGGRDDAAILVLRVIGKAEEIAPRPDLVLVGQ